jgi:cell division protein FtsN
VVPPVAVSVSSIVLIAVAVLSVVVLVLIVVAPWKRVRQEPPLDKDVETRLLLHRPNPEEATGEIPTTRVSDLTERTGDAPTPAGDDTDFAELRDLDD